MGSDVRQVVSECILILMQLKSLTSESTPQHYFISQHNTPHPSLFITTQHNIILYGIVQCTTVHNTALHHDKVTQRAILQTPLLSFPSHSPVGRDNVNSAAELPGLDRVTVSDIDGSTGREMIEFRRKRVNSKGSNRRVTDGMGRKESEGP